MELSELDQRIILKILKEEENNLSTKEKSNEKMVDLLKDIIKKEINKKY